jgi:hypothetical protein
MRLKSFVSFGDELQKISAKRITLSLPTTKEEASKKYKKLRDPAASGLAGGALGAFISRAVGGGTKGPWRTWRIPAAIGGAAGLTDYYAMRPAKRAGRKKKAIPKKKTAMLGSETFTPARSLAQTRAVGRFQDKVIHKGERLRPPTVGQAHLAPGAQI